MIDQRPELCLDFANTNAAGRKGDGADSLGCLGDLAAWLEKNAVIDAARAKSLKRLERTEPAKADRLLNRARRLREAVYKLMSDAAAEKSANPAGIDALSREAVAATKALSIQHTEGAYRWEVTDPSPEAATSAIALSAAALLTGPDLHRVRECGNETCGWLFLDNSKNQSRKWCEMSSCGNKMKARRHYAKVNNAKKRSS